MTQTINACNQCGHHYNGKPFKTGCCSLRCYRDMIRRRRRKHGFDADGGPGTWEAAGFYVRDVLERESVHCGTSRCTSIAHRLAYWPAGGTNERVQPVCATHRAKAAEYVYVGALVEPEGLRTIARESAAAAEGVVTLANRLDDAAKAAAQDDEDGPTL